MSLASRVWLSLAGFLLIAGSVYWLAGGEYAGAPLLLVGAATFCYLGVIGRLAVRRSQEEPEGSTASGESEVHVAPTIWPFAFAIASVIVALGLIVNPWILVVGGLAFAVSAGGWLRDVARGHPDAHRS